MSTNLAWGMNRVRQIIREPWSSIGSYSTGTIGVANGGVTVTGSGTTWVSSAKAGETFNVSGGQYYHVLSIESDTSLTLATAYAGTTIASGGSYTLKSGRTTNATLVDELNSAHRELTAEVGRLDLNYLAVTGTISYVSGTELYALPTTNGVVKKILYVKRTDLSSEKVLTPINFQERGNYILTSTGATSDNIEEHYYLLGTQIGIVPIPTTAATNNITITYIPEATDLTINTSTIILPDDLRELWAYTAAVGLTDDPGVAQKYTALRNVMLSTLGPRQVQEGRRVNHIEED